MTTNKPSTPTKIAPGEYVHFGYTIRRGESGDWYVETETGQTITVADTLKAAAYAAVAHLEGR
jgi:hypothetical protein